jgi:hypothetical protein
VIRHHSKVKLEKALEGLKVQRREALEKADKVIDSDYRGIVVE